MIRYRCDYCGVFLDRPVRIRHTERIGDWTRTYTEDLCPSCGSEDCFSEANYCECGRPKNAADCLCTTCMVELKTRVCEFFDSLTSDEEEQFDEWMDGDTITNRRKWS